VVATVDGGSTWVPYEQPRSFGNPRTIWMFDASDGIATRQFDPPLRTATGGAEWTVVANGPQIELLSCLPTGFCAGLAGRNGPIVVSADRGATWQDTHAPLQQPDRDEIRAIQAISPTLVLAAGSDLGSSYLKDVKPLLDRGEVAPYAPGPRGLLLRWEGSAWTRTTFDDPERLVAMSFPDANHGWLVGMEDNELYKTSDGGRTVKFVPDYFRQTSR
jgi:photosystem II stability/assembly factor-like uncharacterized protein